MKLHNCFIVVGTAIFFIASTLSGLGMMPSLIILNPKYFNSCLAKKYDSTFTVKPTNLNSFEMLSIFSIQLSVGRQYKFQHNLDHYIIHSFFLEKYLVYYRDP